MKGKRGIYQESSLEQYCKYQIGRGGLDKLEYIEAIFPSADTINHDPYQLAFSANVITVQPTGLIGILKSTGKT